MSEDKALRAQTFYPKINVLICVCVLSCLFMSHTQARPTVGLALGGGGAKGTAHVGVLKVLERERVPVDYIAGTSIGSVVGALYALGYSADEIEKIMFSIPWDKAYSDIIPRQGLPFRIKQRGQFNLPLNIGYDQGEVKTPSGVLYGQSASLLLRQAFGNLPTFTSFDDLPIPYRAIATNLSTNKSVTLKSGDLLVAAQASSSVPGILAPIKYDDMLLVDGGITKNIPVDTVKGMGADHVIAIDISDNLARSQDLKDTFSILGQLSSFLTVTSTEEQKILLTDQDLLIRPELNQLSTTDWSTFHLGITRGEQAAEKVLSALKVFSMSETEYQAYRQQKKVKHEKLLTSLEQPISAIVIQNKSRVHEAFIRKQLALSEGQSLDAHELNAAVQRLYNTDEFQRIDASIFDDGTKRRVVVTSEDKSWGPTFLEFGIGWETNFTDKSSIDLDFAYMKRNLTDYGGEWRVQLELGNEASLKSELYLPLTRTRSFFSRTKYSFSTIDYSVGSDSNLPLSVEQNTHQVIQGLGYNFSQNGYFEFGGLIEKGILQDDFVLKNEVEFDALGSYVAFGFDNLDSASFPTHGKRFLVTLINRFEDVDNQLVFTGDLTDFGGRSLALEIEWKGALKIGNHSLVSKTDFIRVYTGEGNNSIQTTRLGGFLNLSGLDSNKLSGTHKAFSALIYQYNLRENLFGQNKLPLYLGFSVEAGNVWEFEADINVEDLLFGTSIYLGTDTPIGPAALGYGITNAKDKSIYFYLGYNL
ncbi:MAG: NTE family protein [Oleiphilaceae bacterium]